MNGKTVRKLRKELAEEGPFDGRKWRQTKKIYKNRNKPDTIITIFTKKQKKLIRKAKEKGLTPIF